MRDLLTGTRLAIMLGLAIVLARVLAYPLLPIDETRYLSVAWEMWQSGNYLVPHLNDLPYPHKPPLLFWLINLAWTFFGTSDLVARLAIPVVGLSAFGLLAAVVRRSEGSNAGTIDRAPLILLSLFPWTIYLALSMFDILVTVCLLLALWSQLRYQSSRTLGWLLLSGFAVGLGMIAKGPVMLVYWLPLMLSYRAWRGEQKGWLKGVGLATLLGVVVVLAWAVPAAIAGGAHYAEAIFWRQSAGRIDNAFAHARPWYWYLKLLPLLLLPWTLTRFWKRPLVATPLQKMALWGFLPQLALFSLFSGKQVHYLVPTLPFIAIWLSEQWPKITDKRLWAVPAILLALAVATWQLPTLALKYFPAAPLASWTSYLAIVPVILALLVWWKPASRWLMVSLPLALNTFLLGLSPAIMQYYDLEPFAQQVTRAQQQHAVAYVGGYANQFRFLGRGTQPLDELLHGTEQWRQEHPDGMLVVVLRHPSEAQKAAAVATSHYRSQFYLLVNTKDWPLFASQPANDAD